MQCTVNPRIWIACSVHSLPPTTDARDGVVAMPLPGVLQLDCSSGVLHVLSHPKRLAFALTALLAAHWNRCANVSPFAWFLFFEGCRRHVMRLPTDLPSGDLIMKGKFLLIIGIALLMVVSNYSGGGGVGWWWLDGWLNSNQKGMSMKLFFDILFDQIISFMRLRTHFKNYSKSFPTSESMPSVLLNVMVFTKKCYTEKKSIR